MRGAIGLNLDAMTLRELLWVYDGISYERWMQTGAIVAGLYNSQRTKTSDRVWTFADFHPAHATARRGKSGLEIVTQTREWFASDEIQWLPGFGPGEQHGDK